MFKSPNYLRYIWGTEIWFEIKANVPSNSFQKDSHETGIHVEPSS